MRLSIIKRPSWVVLFGVALMAGLLAWTRGVSDRSTPFTIAIGAVYPTSASPPYAGALALDARSGHVFVATTIGIRILNIRTGAVVGTIPRASYGDSYGEPLTLATDTAIGHIVVVTGDGIQVLDGRTGAIVHSVAMPMYLLAVAVDQRSGHAFILDLGGRVSGGRVVVLDTRSGRLLHITMVAGGDTRGDMGDIAVDGRARRVFVTKPAAGTVSVLDARTGAALTTTLVDLDRSFGTLAVAAGDGHVFVAGQTGISMLDRRGRTALRRVALGAAPVAMVVDERTHRLVAGDDVLDAFGNAHGITGVSVFDTRSGALLRTIQVASSDSIAALAVDERRGRALVALQGATDPLDGQTFTAPGRVLVLDMRTGALVRTIDAGYAPQAMAVDERDGRIVILNAAVRVRVPDRWAWIPRWTRRWVPFLPSSGPSTRAAPGEVRILDVTR